jgi:D-lyxose ketol-isomerase
MLKRSVINQSIVLAIEVFAKHNLHLPPFAFWTPAEWEAKGHEADEIRDCMLGWDVTDFGYGQFDFLGRILFTLRNGKGKEPYPKTYAEKFILDPPGQRAPLHYHRSKREDIINRGQKGEIIIELRVPDANGDPSTDAFDIQVNGVTRHIERGPYQLHLQPGESVCLHPGIMHQFWGADGDISVSGEVSGVCDDVNDNVFIGDANIRFPSIDEDEPRRYYLCNEYPTVND